MNEKRFFMQKLIEYLKKKKLTPELIGAYIVGSSNVDLEKSSDIDIMFIADDSYCVSYKEKIHGLQYEIFQCNAINGTFDATDENIKENLRKFIEKFDFAINIEYAIGPLKKQFSDDDYLDSALTLHVCGPMKKSDFRTFFYLFPFHGLGFINLHKRIFGVGLGDLFKQPLPTITDYQRWQKSNYNRISKINIKEKKIKVLKTMILTKYLFDDPITAYFNTNRKLAEFLSIYPDINELVKNIFEFCEVKHG